MIRVRSRRLMSEINVVPYIDVMLVLLIIFMITAPLLTQGIPLQLPRADAQPIELPAGSEPLVLSVDIDGSFYLSVGEMPELPIDEQTVIELTAAVVRRNPGVPVFLRADDAATHGRVMTAYSLLVTAGVERPVIVTEPRGR
jgi:biopolymer transport protein TolR